VHVIAIDGPAASGKSSTAAAVAGRLGWLHLDTGALYRAVTLAALDHLEDAEQRSAQRVRDLAGRLPIELVRVGDGFRPVVAGVDVSGPIRAPRVTAAVSTIAALGEVREWVTGEIRRAVGVVEEGVVIDGRDIGTAVFPEAPLKVYLTASAQARAGRRLAQDGQPASPEAVSREAARLTVRDSHDRERVASPLRQAPDAIRVDTTTLTFEAQVEAVTVLARKVFGD
jgi:cytidylate kinase